MPASCYLTKFHMIRPQFELKQQDALDWLVLAHTRAEKTAKKFNEREEKAFAEALRKRLLQVSCDPTRIATRGHVLRDFLHHNWEEMEIYRLHDSPNGVDLQERHASYDRIVSPIMREFYQEESDPPQEIIHVTCTGYLAPSPLQKLISHKGWGAKTATHHAYHMGCYGAFPAIKIGRGLLNHIENVDIVHTEVCTLHSNTALHDADQLVAQSLFADGFIKYGLSRERQKGALKVVALHEEIIPNSEESMVWNLASWGFFLRLGKEIPVLIRRALSPFLKHLCQSADLDPEEVVKNARFAIHPGGPKILDYIQKEFALSDDQISSSRQILKRYGNISSATLPHIWEAMSSQPGVVVSLAFGPGLTIHGGLMEVV
ncbi:MAG: Alpha-pyrone synthesis polyketide synthase-like Pks18 [Chlamydiae bacterium]|nr:Alpha-pyrone synthesis polyketide synthase-like Pks18 [Chlamydiota bacterium]